MQCEHLDRELLTHACSDCAAPMLRSCVASFTSHCLRLTTRDSRREFQTASSATAHQLSVQTSSRRELACTMSDEIAISDLPLSVLSLFFQHLGPIDLHSCSGVSTVWRQQSSTSPRWKDLFHRTWRYWERSKYQDAIDAGRYKQAFEMRAKVRLDDRVAWQQALLCMCTGLHWLELASLLQVNKVAQIELDRLPEPLSRLDAINKLINLGDDAKDSIFGAAALRGDLTIGFQHWGQHALRLCLAAWCGAKITTFLEEGDADLDCLHPALLLVMPAAAAVCCLQKADALRLFVALESVSREDGKSC